MNDFSEFIKAVRLSYDEESPIRKFADAVSKADTLQKVIYLNSERRRLQSECNLLIQISQLTPTIDVSEALRNRLDLINQCRCLLVQMGNDVVADRAQIDTILYQTMASVEAGMATKNDLLRIEARQGQVKYQQEQVANGVELCRMALCDALGFAHLGSSFNLQRRQSA